MLKWLGRILFAGLAVLPATVSGGVWQTEYELPFSAEYTRNLDLVPGEDEITRRVVVSPRYSLIWADGSERIYGQVGLQLEHTDAPSQDQDRSDPRGTIGWHHRLARGGFGLSVSHERTAMRVTEIEETGLAGTDADRQTQSVAWAWDYAVTGRTTVDLTGSYRVVSYDDETFDDYNQHITALTVTSAVTARTSLSARVEAEQHRTDEGDDSDLYNFRVGMEQKSSERTTFVLQGGGFRSVGEDEVSGWAGGTAVDYRFFMGKAVLNCERDVTTNSARGLVETDRYVASLDFGVDARTTVGVKVGRRDMRSTVNERFEEVGIAATRRLSRAWSVGATGRSFNLAVDGSNAAWGYVVGVNLTYSGANR